MISQSQQSPLLIAASGFATVGKDFFCNLLSYKLKELDFYVKRYALADQLKADLYFFIKQNFDFDIYSCNADQKTLIRPILVEYGRSKRIQSQGIFWTSIIKKRIKEDKPDIAILNDIRYDQYLQDEVFWVKEKMKGVLVHISRYELKRKYEKDSNEYYIEFQDFIKAPNEDEKINDPKLRAK
ncbi:MAG: hypothetical protein AABY22_11360, partial [Nanoarchaeota archaeon]